jgi:TM2 domain-containing membrane protein YozV
MACFYAIFLLWLWVHKFYLGKPVQWFIYILFIFTFMPFIISLVEWFLYLVNSREWFYINYNINYIEWRQILEKNKL